VNRRGFLQTLAAATAISAGGIMLIETPKTFFLPPRGGWHQALKIRRVEQYLINSDEIRYVYDAAWTLPDGFIREYYVDASTPCNEVAKLLLKSQMEAEQGAPSSSLSDEYWLSRYGARFEGYIYA
jgi:hypothetical protein